MAQTSFQQEAPSTGVFFVEHTSSSEVFVDSSVSSLLSLLSQAGVVILHGDALRARSDEWIDVVVAGTRDNPMGLLSKSRVEIESVVREDRVFVAFHEPTGAFVACVVLWELVDEWSELGTVYVVPPWRFGHTGLPITQVLHRVAVAAFEEAGRFVIETSTVPAVVHGARTRHGMETPSFHDLPVHVHAATCCCPFDKTGTDDNVRACRRKDNPCVLMVGTKTHAYLQDRRGR